MVENFGDKIFIKIIDKRNAFALIILKEKFPLHSIYNCLLEMIENSFR